MTAQIFTTNAAPWQWQATVQRTATVFSLSKAPVSLHQIVIVLISLYQNDTVMWRGMIKFISYELERGTGILSFHSIRTQGFPMTNRQPFQNKGYFRTFQNNKTRLASGIFYLWAVCEQIIRKRNCSVICFAFAFRVNARKARDNTVSPLQPCVAIVIDGGIYWQTHLRL